jgi:hypothetical protein
MVYFSDISTAQRIDSKYNVLAFKVRKADNPYYIYSGKYDTSFPASGNNEYGPYPVPDEESDIINYHEISNEVGNIYIKGTGSVKIELICYGQ